MVDVLMVNDAEARQLTGQFSWLKQQNDHGNGTQIPYH